MILPSLLRKFGRSASYSEPTPEAPICVVGDLHGELDLFRRLLDKIPTGYQVILVGDYVDRGPRSADVLRLLFESDNFLCLRGNHEEMLSNFLDGPTSEARKWLRHGGQETLASFGVPLVQDVQDENAINDAQAQLKAEMGEDLQRWLLTLQTSVQTGNMFISHAGADPDRDLAGQGEHSLVWGHPKFLKKQRRDGYWVVHGHYIQAEAKVRNGRIGVDTGAYTTGVLSAACLGEGAPRFITACI